MRSYSIWVLLTFAAATLLFSCGEGGILPGGKDDPKEVARKFTQSVKKGDIEAAKGYCTPQSGRFVEAFMKMGAGAGQVGFLGKDMELRDSIVGEVAYVFLLNPKNPDENPPTRLVKVDGEWKVEMMLNFNGF
jgi:hypothetical protein